MWNGLLTHASSKSQESAGMLAKMTFRDHVALKLRASDVFSTQLLNVILRGSHVCAVLTFAGSMGSKPTSSFLIIILASPITRTVLTFAGSPEVQSPFFRQSWRRQNEISLPPHPPPPLHQVQLSNYSPILAAPRLHSEKGVAVTYLRVGPYKS